MKKKLFTGMIIVFLGIFLGACSARHVPNPGAVNIAIEAEKAKNVSVNVINAQDDSTEIRIGRAGFGTMYGDLHSWSETAVKLVKTTLEKEGFAISDAAPKTLKLSVTEAILDVAGIEFVAALPRCKVSLKIETAEGYSKTYEESNKAMMPPGACDKAMTSVVSSLMKDQKVLDYLQR